MHVIAFFPNLERTVFSLVLCFLENMCPRPSLWFLLHTEQYWYCDFSMLKNFSAPWDHAPSLDDEFMICTCRKGARGSCDPTLANHLLTAAIVVYCKSQGRLVPTEYFPVTYLVTKNRSGRRMSSKGSAYAGDGREYLQEPPPAKQPRYDHPAQPHVIEGEGKNSPGVWAGVNDYVHAALFSVTKRTSSLP